MIQSFRAAVVLCFLLVLNCTPAREFGTRYTKVIDLQGSWLFRLDETDAGIAGRWFEQMLPDTVFLPGSTDENRIGKPYDGSLEPPVTLYRDITASPTLSKLTRLYTYVGPAWYQRDIVIPDDWYGKRITLFLERCHWESRVWVDGQACGLRNSLSAPHTYELPVDLAPGIHRLTIRVDNTIRLDVGRIFAHSVTEHTQTNWNGIIGRIELQATDPVWIDDVRVFPNVENRTHRVVLDVGNRTRQQVDGSVRLTLRDGRGRNIQNRAQPVAALVPGASQVTIEWQQEEAPLWDIYAPQLLELGAELSTATETGKYVHDHMSRFGMRSFTHNSQQLLLNGRVTYLRGTLECCIFPLTGYPAMDVEAWSRMLGIAGSYGLNFIRFHSWCPPEAAFTAADRLGMILLVEAPVWTHDLGREPERDQWLEQEITRILDTYGNHPSFCLFSLGNELEGDVDFMKSLVIGAKEHDPRRLYTTSSAGGMQNQKGPQSCDDFLDANAYNGIKMRARSWFPDRFEKHPPETASDYRRGLVGLSIPFIVHEIGEWAVYPDFREIEKYTGVLRPRNFELFRDSLAAHHMLDQSADFVKASGALSALLFKEEIESHLRTPGLGGFKLLALYDYPGEGTSLVGMLNAFWESKGIVSPEEHRRYCGDIVPLARMEKRSWTNDETFHAKMEIAQYGAEDLKDVMPVWSLTDERGSAIAHGEFARQTVRQGGLTELGVVEASLQPVREARRLQLQLVISGTEYRNAWNLWVYPSDRGVERPQSVVIAGSMDASVWQQLQHGASVLLLPKLASLQKALPGRFTTIFWSPIYVPHLDSALTMGLLCRPGHPALAMFPTDYHTDWQWWDPVTRSKALVLEAAPPEFRPIVQVIDQFNRNLRLGSLFEARVGTGRLMVSAFDLVSDLDDRPAARQLLRSILAYMASDDFQPEHEMSWDILQQIVR